MDQKRILLSPSPAGCAILFRQFSYDVLLTLHEALHVPELFKPYVPDMKINLFEIAWLSRETVEKFNSDFRMVADYFVQKQENGDYIPRLDELIHVQETIQLLRVMTGDYRFEEILNDDSEKGAVKNMCDVLDRAEMRGRQQGMQQGLQQGMQQGLQQAKEKLSCLSDEKHALVANPGNGRAQHP